MSVSREETRWTAGTRVVVLHNEDGEGEWQPAVGDEGVVIGHEDSRECVNVDFGPHGTFWLWNDEVEVAG